MAWTPDRVGSREMTWTPASGDDRHPKRLGELLGSVTRRLGLATPDALRLVEGPLAKGFAEGAPYDGILIEGAIPEVPAAIADQLAEGGRLVTVLAAASRGVTSRAVIGRRIAGGFSMTDAFDCATLPLPAFRPAPGFVF